MSEKTIAFDGGAVRSSDASHLDFTSLPLVGLIGVARTAAEGANKYGRYNYMQGMPVHDLLNHSLRHIVLFTLGDRSEPHLEHAAWGLLAAIQSQALDPEISAPHLLGPGATLTQANLDYLAEQAPKLKAKREAGEFHDSGRWSLDMLPEIQALLDQREWLECGGAPTPEEHAELDNAIESACRRLDAATKPFVHPIYGPCERIEVCSGKPTPGPGETWVEYDDGTRAYYSSEQRATRTESHVPIVGRRDSKAWDL